MTLEEFITDTIIQIIKGVKNAQDFAKQNGAKVNPSNIKMLGNENSPAYWDNYNSIAGQSIDFDISVTTHEEGQTEGKAGVFVAFLKAGVSGKESSEQIAVNKIKFSIPVFLPIQQKVNE